VKEDPFFAEEPAIMHKGKGRGKRGGFVEFNPYEKKNPVQAKAAPVIKPSSSSNMGASTKPLFHQQNSAM